MFVWYNRDVSVWYNIRQDKKCDELEVNLKLQCLSCFWTKLNILYCITVTRIVLLNISFHWKLLHNFSIVDEKQADDYTLQVTLLSSFFRYSSTLVQWLSGGMYAQGSSGCLSWDLGWPRPTPCAPFAQTAASHGLDYSTALPVPANFIGYYSHISDCN